jgi:hypothetical protein
LAECTACTSSGCCPQSALHLGRKGPLFVSSRIRGAIPRPDEMTSRMRRRFSQAEWTPYTFGTAGLYRGVK